MHRAGRWRSGIGLLPSLSCALALAGALSGCGDSSSFSDAQGDVGGAGDAASGGDATALAVCAAGAKTGAYCGGDQVDHGDPNTLYTCKGPGAPGSATPCAGGCVIAPAGQDDSCKPVTSPDGYRLPWGHDTSMLLTQDCNDSCCSDHVGIDEYAWDFANGSDFIVRAARAGTITHLKLNSTTGCGSLSCANYVNMVVIDHGDDTQSTYMHLKGGSAQAGITCGAHVDQGQALAVAGTTGYSTGVHLHFQVNKAHAGAPTCECGSDGTQCAELTNLYANVWVDAAHPSLPIDFEEWQASQCGNRRLTLPTALD